MSEVDSKKRIEDEKILKDLSIVAFNKWSAENPVARTIQASAERLPTLSNSTFSRIIDSKYTRGASLDEAIEILTLTNHLELSMGMLIMWGLTYYYSNMERINKVILGH